VAVVNGPGGYLLRRRVELHPAEHLVQDEGQLVTRLGQPVHVGRFWRHEGVTDARDPTSEMAHPIGMHQVCYRVAVGVEIRAERQGVHRIHGTLPEGAIRLAIGVAQNLTVRRVGGVTIDPG
jgi:hypothetical protein